MPGQSRVWKYLVLGVLSWIVVGMVAIALSSTPGFSGYGSVKAQPTPPIEDTTDIQPDSFSAEEGSPDTE